MTQLVVCLFFTTLVFAHSSVGLDVTGCGTTKGCFRVPGNCTVATCVAIVTWEKVGDEIKFELNGESDGWVAVGFSEDNKMGTDSVMECLTDKVQMSYNEGKSNQALSPPAKTITNDVVSSTDGRIDCSFSRKVAVAGNTRVFDLSTDYYLLLGVGPTGDNSGKGFHSTKGIPTPSPSKISMDSKENIAGQSVKNDFTWVKVHGVLMSCGWLLFASIGIITARYHKKQWPGKEICGKDVWFGVHRGLMLSAVVCTLTGFIIICVHVQDFITNAVHPWLGLAVTLLALINPIMAFCRPGHDNRRRKMFDWAHWGVGTAAHIVAVCAIFFGIQMPTGKVIAQGWVFWVLIGYVVFHILTEIILKYDKHFGSNQEMEGKVEAYELNARSKKPSYQPAQESRLLTIAYFVYVVGVVGIVIAVIVGLTLGEQ